MTTALTKRDDNAISTTTQPSPGIQLKTFEDLKAFASAAVASGFFKDAKGAAQAIIKVQYGMEIGVSPVVAINSIHCVDGKMTVSAGLIASQMARAGYVVKIDRLDDTACELTITKGGTVLGRSTFTEADAKRAELAGKAMWKKYPRNMLYSRAISNAQKWYAAEVFGSSVYTPEEVASSDVPIDVVMTEARVEERLPEAATTVRVVSDAEQIAAVRTEIKDLLVAGGVDLADIRGEIESVCKVYPTTLAEWTQVRADLIARHTGVMR